MNTRKSRSWPAVVTGCVIFAAVFVLAPILETTPVAIAVVIGIVASVGLTILLIVLAAFWDEEQDR